MYVCTYLVGLIIDIYLLGFLLYNTAINHLSPWLHVYGPCLNMTEFRFMFIFTYSVLNVIHVQQDIMLFLCWCSIKEFITVDISNINFIVNIISTQCELLETLNVQLNTTWFLKDDIQSYIIVLHYLSACAEMRCLTLATEISYTFLVFRLLFLENVSSTFAEWAIEVNNDFRKSCCNYVCLL